MASLRPLSPHLSCEDQDRTHWHRVFWGFDEVWCGKSLATSLKTRSKEETSPSAVKRRGTIISGRGATGARTTGQQGQGSSWGYESTSRGDTRNKDTRSVPRSPVRRGEIVQKVVLGKWPPIKLDLFLKQNNIYLAVKGLSCGRICDLRCGRQTLSCSMRDPGLWPGIEPRPPARGTRSLSHWTARQVPKTRSFIHTKNKDGSRWIKDNMKCKIRKIRSYIYTME